VEEASRRGAKTLIGGADQRHGGAGRPHLVASGPRLLPVSSRVFPRLVRDFFVADKFCGKYALESLFSPFVEIDPRKYKIYKTHGNYQFKS